MESFLLSFSFINKEIMKFQIKVKNVFSKYQTSLFFCIICSFDQTCFNKLFVSFNNNNNFLFFVFSKFSNSIFPIFTKANSSTSFNLLMFFEFFIEINVL